MHTAEKSDKVKGQTDVYSLKNRVSEKTLFHSFKRIKKNFGK